MKKVIIAIGAASLLIAGCSSSTSDAAELDPIDTGIYGITVPGDAEETGISADIATYKLPAWDFEDASEWMGEQMSPLDEVGGMAFYDASRDQQGHSWCYQTENTDGTFDLLAILVGKGGGPNNAPVSVYVSRGTDEIGC